MKKLDITKEQFNKSRYFQKKYGKLKYVSESGKLFKTSKGRVLKFNESSEDDDVKTLLDVEELYGIEVKDALVEYCELKGKSPYDVVNDETEDKRGMCAWDLFDAWCKTKKGINVMDDYEKRYANYDWTGADSQNHKVDEGWKDDAEDMCKKIQSDNDELDIGLKSSTHNKWRSGRGIIKGPKSDKWNSLTQERHGS